MVLIKKRKISYRPFRRGPGPLLLAVLFLLAVVPAGGAYGAPVFELDFSKAVDPSVQIKGGGIRDVFGTRGWLGASPDSASPGHFLVPAGPLTKTLSARGAIEMRLQRLSQESEGYNRTSAYNTLFTIRGKDGSSLTTVYLVWEFGYDTHFVSALDITTEKGPYNLWGNESLDTNVVRKGDDVTVIITWGDTPEEARVYVDGRDITPAFAPNEKEGWRTRAEVARRIALFREAMQDAGTIIFGTDQVIGRGFIEPAEEVLFKYVAFHDTPVYSEITSASAVSDLQIASVEHDASTIAGFSNKLVAGDIMTVVLEGSPGAEATFDVAGLSSRRGYIHLDWRGFGVYLEEKVFFDDDEINLRDIREYRVYADTKPLVSITDEMEPVEVLDVQEQSYTLEGLEIEAPYYTAVVALMDDGTLRPVLRSRTGLPMLEDPEIPGRYVGTFRVDHEDVYPEAIVVGRLSSGDAGVGFPVAEPFEIDGSLTITVLTAPDLLEADEKSSAEILVTVTDANEEPVAGHELRFLLVTTSEYTGVVGGGLFTDEVGGSLRRDFRGITDMFGQVTATYTAGFAAKTAIIVARDMLSNDTGAGYVRTFIRARAELELEAVQQVAGKALGYAIAVTSSDDWLTADGESKARITALVTRDGIPVEGHRVSFQVAAGSGSIRAVSDTTDAGGKARAVYTAGKRIGIVLIRAVDQQVGISGTVQIELRSDAPAKIAITLSEDLIPADGRSTVDVDVVVTDINDNPNEGVEVEYEVVIGSGRLRNIDAITDDRGTSSARYVAGRVPGKVTIEVTVTSSVPTEEEMLAGRGLALAVPDYAFF